MDPQVNELARDYDSLTREATRLAGALKDLGQRATVYHHLYKASHGNHAFPLIAAHGALWAGGYFRFGARLAKVLSFQYIGSPARRREQLQKLEAFADAFRDINRRVCIDTYVNFHFTAKHGRDPRASQFVSRDLLQGLNLLHAARRSQHQLPVERKKEIFLAHFLNEQQHVVGPAIAKAIADFDWPLLRFIALKPLVRFAYLPLHQPLWFRNFASRDERVAKGEQAFDAAADAGWLTVEQTLASYNILPRRFLTDSAQYFQDFKATHLAAA